MNTTFSLKQKKKNKLIYVFFLNKSMLMVFFFLFQVDGADVGCGSSGHGSAAVWPGESVWVWLRPAAPAGPSSLLRGHTYGCYEGTGEWINSDSYCPVREYLWLVFNVYIQVVHDVSAEKLFLRDLVAAGAVTDLTGALGVSRAESDDTVATPWTLTLDFGINSRRRKEKMTIWCSAFRKEWKTKGLSNSRTMPLNHNVLVT